MMGEGDAINDSDASDVEELSTVDEPQNEGPAEGDSASDSASANGSPDDQNVADALPSFDQVETSFETNVESRTEQPEESGSATVDVMGLEEDPAVIAKAVRTLLKRDEEG